MIGKTVLALAMFAAGLTPDQEARIKKLESRLMAPCCYSQTILEHRSQEAYEMREEVTALVAAGKSEEEIITYYRTKYGETILVEPDGMSGGLLTAIPITLFSLATGLVILILRRSVQAKLAAAPAMPVPAPEDGDTGVRSRIRAELGEL